MVALFCQQKNIVFCCGQSTAIWAIEIYFHWTFSSQQDNLLPNLKIVF